MYLNVYASLQKYCKDFITARPSLGQFKIFDFDAQATIDELPEGGNLIGVAELSLTNNGGLHDVTCSLVVSTPAADNNLVLLRKVMDALYDELQEGFGGGALKIVKADTGQAYGHMTVKSGTTLLPVARTKGRPMQVILVSLGAVATPA